MAGGGWRVAGGGWRVAGGGWRVAGGGWRVPGFGCRVPGAGCRVPDCVSDKQYKQSNDYYSFWLLYLNIPIQSQTETKLFRKLNSNEQLVTLLDRKRLKYSVVV